MAENMPRTTPEFLDWSKVHADLWQVDPPSIGLSPAQAMQFAALADELRAANFAAEQAREASKSATLALNDVLSRARAAGGTFVGMIKAFAEVTQDPGVYPRAGVSRVAPQGTLPPPTPPTSISSRIDSQGSLILKWKARQPVGVTDVVYLIRRMIDRRGEFELVGTEGANKTFTDTTIPIGTSMVEYLITPKRGEATGQSGPIYSVRFGSAGRSGATAPAVKMAA
jgi:hypothetical protein